MESSAEWPREGSLAPEFVLRGVKGHALALADLRGRPVVLAFGYGWRLGGGSGDEIDAIRAELRGLGAVLLVLSDAGIWCFRADDEVELVLPKSDAVDREIAQVARLYGCSGAPALFVLDAEGTVRFAHAPSGPSAELLPTLAGALDAAGRALASRARPASPASPNSIGMTRREVVLTSLVAGFALAFVDGCAKPRNPVTTTGAQSAGAAGEVDVVLRVNGQDRTVRIDPRVTLLDALRERMALPGTKKGCDMGQCGACTVLLDGRRVNACLQLAIMTQGSEITTIEGLAKGDELHPVQSAFIAEDGFQCGYCTPGQIMSAVGLLAEGRATTADEIREEMSGNLCRCGAYPNIVRSIQRARKGA